MFPDPMVVRPGKNGEKGDASSPRRREVSEYGLKSVYSTLGVAVLLVLAVSTPLASAGPASLRSQSGQFVVSSSRTGVSGPVASLLATNQQFIELDPTLLVISCEHIRQAVARELGVTSPWRGRIAIHLFPVTSVEDAFTLKAEHFRDGWNYRLHVPDVAERSRLLRALVQVILLEIANRESGEHSAEVPVWLAVGLAEHVLASAKTEFLFAPPRQRVGGLNLNQTQTSSRRGDPLAAVRQSLRAQTPVTLEQLSWPVESDFTGDTAEAYRASAHLFVAELLRFRDGSACFRAFLRELPGCLNWQTAFLKGFRSHFERLLDVEKWWALQVVYASGRELFHTWPAAESWHKIAEAIRVPTQVRASPDQLPTADSVALQTVVREWDTVRQTSALRARVQQLDLVRQRSALELLPLAEDYRRVLARFLEQRDKAGVVLARGPAIRPGLVRLIRDTVLDLNRLDEQLQSARPAVMGGLSPSDATTNLARETR